MSMLERLLLVCGVLGQVELVDLREVVTVSLRHHLKPTILADNFQHILTMMIHDHLLSLRIIPVLFGGVGLVLRSH